MTPTALYFLEEIGEITCVRFSEKLVAHHPPTQIYDLVRNEGKTRIILDFTNVELITSTALGVFITFHRKIHAQGGKLAIYGLDDRLRDLLKISLLHRVFHLCSSFEEALEVASST